jgi:hypothetical protein
MYTVFWNVAPCATIYIYSNVVKEPAESMFMAEVSTLLHGVRSWKARTFTTVRISTPTYRSDSISKLHVILLACTNRSCNYWLIGRWVRGIVGTQPIAGQLRAPPSPANGRFRYFTSLIQGKWPVFSQLRTSASQATWTFFNIPLLLPQRQVSNKWCTLHEQYSWVSWGHADDLAVSHKSGCTEDSPETGHARPLPLRKKWHIRNDRLPSNQSSFPSAGLLQQVICTCTSRPSAKEGKPLT